MYITVVCSHSSLIRAGSSMSVVWRDKVCEFGRSVHLPMWITLMWWRGWSIFGRETVEKNHLHALKPPPNHFLLFQVIYFSNAVPFFHRCLLLYCFRFDLPVSLAYVNVYPSFFYQLSLFILIRLTLNGFSLTGGHGGGRVVVCRCRCLSFNLFHS